MEDVQKYGEDVKAVYFGVDGSFRRNGMAVAEVTVKESRKVVATYLFKDLRHFQKWFDNRLASGTLPDPKITTVGYEQTGKAYVVHSNKYRAWLTANKMTHTQALRDKYAMSVGANIAATKYAMELFKEVYKASRVIPVDPASRGTKLLKPNGIRMLSMLYKVDMPEYEYVSQDEIDAVQVACIIAGRKGTVL